MLDHLKQRDEIKRRVEGVLDWLTSQKMSDRRVELLGRMRFFSKTSAGIAALIGGVLVWSTGQVSSLFWAALVPTLMGVVLLMGYPDSP